MWKRVKRTLFVVLKKETRGEGQFLFFIKTSTIVFYNYACCKGNFFTKVDKVVAGGYFKNKLQLFDVSTFVLFEKGPFSCLFKEVDPKYVSTLCQVFNFEKAEEKNL